MGECENDPNLVGILTYCGDGLDTAINWTLCAVTLLSVVFSLRSLRGSWSWCWAPLAVFLFVFQVRVSPPARVCVCVWLCLRMCLRVMGRRMDPTPVHTLERLTNCSPVSAPDWPVFCSCLHRRQRRVECVGGLRAVAFVRPPLGRRSAAQPCDGGRHRHRAGVLHPRLGVLRGNHRGADHHRTWLRRGDGMPSGRGLRCGVRQDARRVHRRGRCLWRCHGVWPQRQHRRRLSGL